MRCSLTQNTLPTSGLAWKLHPGQQIFPHVTFWTKTGKGYRFQQVVLVLMMCHVGEIMPLLTPHIDIDQPLHQDVSGKNLFLPLFSPQVSILWPPFFVFLAPTNGVIPLHSLFLIFLCLPFYYSAFFLANLLSGFNNTSVPGYDILPDHTSHICIQFSSDDDNSQHLRLS